MGAQGGAGGGREGREKEQVKGQGFYLERAGGLGRRVVGGVEEAVGHNALAQLKEGTGGQHWGGGGGKR